jgi:hypothetical protein
MMTEPTAPQVMQMILAAARAQIAASAEGQAIIAAGLGKQLDELIHSTAANAANPICWAFAPEE